MRITANQVVEELKRVVSGNEDYVYSSPDSVIGENQCVYVDPLNLRPSCIVGKWLVDVHGIDPIELSQQADRAERVVDNDGTVKFEVDSDSAGEIVPGYLDIDENALMLLSEAQSVQDSGANPYNTQYGKATWGTALKAVISTFEDYE